MQPKYKTERQLKARVYELATQNKQLLDLLSFNLQDLETGSMDKGLDADSCKLILERTLAKIEEVTNASVQPTK